MIRDLIGKLYGSYEGIKLLDVGCSEGAFLSYMLGNGVKAEAIDAEETAINFCQKRGYGDCVKYGDIRKIPYEDNTFDVVTALDVVEHVKEDTVSISELMRVCKAGGLVIIILPAHQWLWSSNDEVVHHVKRYSKKEAVNLLRNFNAGIEFSSYFNMILFPVFVLATLWRKIFPKPTESNVVVDTPKPVNYVLCRIMDIENYILTRLNFTMPFGSSMIFICRKNAG